ncbi:hypothetical protein HHK36_022730 [Tetracentron sinense]|uniref:N-acetyltransferase domain-containing protein n=1 Tax=Tetracentron sinense TaxID=13715 RepID=A0A834Y7U8_TETSI|nr:hypothetical protein HHK36_033274 [Tetracentron sinense]KAF8392388.1 hypothetical protein HHK36_022730 [Tetracentron sinense]
MACLFMVACIREPLLLRKSYPYSINRIKILQPSLTKLTKGVQMERISSKSDGKEIEEGSSEISLRRFDLSDVDDFMVWATDDRVSRFCSWDTFTCREDAAKYIKNTIIPHPWFRAICINNRPIGEISVLPLSGEYRCRGELECAIATKYWGQRIATKALKMVVSSIFSEWPYLQRLEAVVYVENAGSQRVLEKVGFQREGVLRKFLIKKGRAVAVDVVMFSLLSTHSKL